MPNSTSRAKGCVDEIANARMCQFPLTRSCLVLGAVRDDLRRYCSGTGKEMTMKAIFAFGPRIHVLGAERVGAERVVSVSALGDGLCPACGCRLKVGTAVTGGGYETFQCMASRSSFAFGSPACDVARPLATRRYWPSSRLAWLSPCFDIRVRSSTSCRRSGMPQVANPLSASYQGSVFRPAMIPF
jgi:hypothetical protein